MKIQSQIINQFGDTDVFQRVARDLPTLQAGHVLIQVHATSVNQIDVKIRSGAVANIAPAFPAVLHSDVAGTVLSVAEDVTHFSPGDKVFGCAGGMQGVVDGALSEVMLADAKLLAHKPTSISMRQAAALPLVSITAWMALVDKLNLQANETILIHGGAGGVGHIALQLARYLGATAYTTVGSEQDAEKVLHYGAKASADFRTEKVADYVARLTQGKGFNAIFDTVGGPNLQNSMQACALNGSIATTAARVTTDLSPLHSLGASLHCVFMLIPLIHNQRRECLGQILGEIAKLVDAGKLLPEVDPHQFSLAEAGQAHALLESGKAKGKVVIDVIKANS